MPNGDKTCIIYLAWGETGMKELQTSLDSSDFKNYDVFLITNHETQVPNIADLNIIRTTFEYQGFMRKCELFRNLPSGYSTFVYLDTDTRVIGDIEFAIEKAKKFGLAMAPAPHYSLEHFWGFDKVMEAEGMVQRGQLQYNSGVIFFSLKHPDVVALFELWVELAIQYLDYGNDQPLLTMAMEKMGVYPYTLSQNYNYRGFGDYISGDIYIWHSKDNLPDNINDYDVAWPRRYIKDGKVYYDVKKSKKWTPAYIYKALRSRLSQVRKIVYRNSP